MSKPATVNSNKWLRDQLNNPEIADIVEQERQRLKLAEIIYKAREAAGLTQAQLAEMIGTSQPAIARLESAAYERVSFSTLSKIAHALDLILEINFVQQVKSEKIKRSTLSNLTNTA